MKNLQKRPTRVAIVGCGNVGATFAYALLLSGLASEIVLIDANHAKAEGEAMDLNHAMPLGRPVRIWAGDYKDCKGALLTVVTAGAAQRLRSSGRRLRSARLRPTQSQAASGIPKTDPRRSRTIA